MRGQDYGANNVRRILVEAGLSPSAPIDTSLTPLLQMKSRALFTLAILWKRILPLSGLGSLSPEGQKKYLLELK